MRRFASRFDNGMPGGYPVWVRVVFLVMLLGLVLWLQAKMGDPSSGCYRLFDSEPMETLQ